MTDVHPELRNIGYDARPTGLLRMIERPDRSACRLQYQWRGEFGEMWIDVPMVKNAWAERENT